MVPQRCRQYVKGTSEGEVQLSYKSREYEQKNREHSGWRVDAWPSEKLELQHTFVETLPGDKESQNRLRQVEGALYSLVDPTPTEEEPTLVALSRSVCELLDLDAAEAARPEFALFFAGEALLPSSRPYAQCYGGHQFGSWAGQLGDGRAISLGEVVNARGERYELQLKGAGKTPYSRRADGRAVMRSSIREFIASEALHHLGIPTTRALSLVATGDGVFRDMFYNGDVKLEPGAVVCRVAPSFVRFGTFQLPASRDDSQTHLIKDLADYVISYHYPELEGVNEKYRELYQEVVNRTARLVARWQTVGFVHGVLNTDNMSILGVTLDYGPYGFLDRFDPDFTPNLTDAGGRRYAFRNQPEIGQWNLAQLGFALVRGQLIEEDAVVAALQGYGDAMMQEYGRIVAQKMGFREHHRSLSMDYYKLMYEHDMDFTLAWRCLAEVHAADDSSAPIPRLMEEALMGTEEARPQARQALQQWLVQYRAALREEGMDEAQRRQLQNSVNPLYIPRQHVLQEAIEKAEQGAYSATHQLLELVESPFEERPGTEAFWRPPRPEQIKPGVTMLSCSS